MDPCNITTLTPVLPSSRQQLLDGGVILARTASVLLIHSGLRLQSCLDIAAEGAIYNRSFYHSLSLLQATWNTDSHEVIREAFPRDLLNNALKSAGAAAFHASQSAIKIQTIIGHELTLPTLLWRTNPKVPTMLEIQTHLVKTVEQIAAATAASTDFKEELSTIKDRIDDMLLGAKDNLTHAKNTIAAAENILSQATSVVRAMERVGARL